ncbi:major facilitator superfamily domain-containing protein [Infundibulicybe gibba]|nr:major facilitator superfamily domain-containing protein [Infundibulicybe gibba]
MDRMAEIEKSSASKGADGQSHAPERPTALGLKGIYYHPVTQVSMLGVVCFTCSGEHTRNAHSLYSYHHFCRLVQCFEWIRRRRTSHSTTSANANAALYAMFAFSAFFAGTINNKLGSRLTLLLGCTGYSLYMGSYLAVNIHPSAGGFVIAAGAILGISAGLLWAAQGSLILAYPTEGQKGRLISIFFAIFNLGGVVGASVSLGQNFHSTSNSVGNGTYICFLVLTLIGLAIPLLMVDPQKMIRTDGTKVAAPRHLSWKIELYGLWVTLRTDPMIVLLFPMFLASNWFPTWQYNDYNGAIFNIQARSLNNLVYWIAQIAGSIMIGTLLDHKNIRRRARAFSGWVVLLGMVFIVHTWGYFYQRQYTRESIPPDAQKMDIHDPGYVGRIWLYIFCGLLGAMWQTTVFWIMGAMSNDPAKLAHFSGLYTSIQSAGAAGVWRADAVKLPYMNVFLSTWILLVAGLLLAFPMLYFRVKNHTGIMDEALARMDDTGNVRSQKLNDAFSGF